MSTKNQEIWRSRVNDYRASNKTAKLWCEENNISVSTLKYWIVRLNKEQNKSFKNLEFVPIETNDISVKSYPSATIKLGKISIDISDGCPSDTIKAILDAIKIYV